MSHGWGCRGGRETCLDARRSLLPISRRNIGPRRQVLGIIGLRSPICSLHRAARSPHRTAISQGACGGASLRSDTAAEVWVLTPLSLV